MFIDSANEESLVHAEDSRGTTQHFGKFIIVENSSYGVHCLADTSATHLVSSELW